MIHFGDPECRVRVNGKQVLLDDRHFADAICEKSAQAIGIALTYAGARIDRVPRQFIDTMEQVLA